MSPLLDDDRLGHVQRDRDGLTRIGLAAGSTETPATVSGDGLIWSPVSWFAALETASDAPRRPG